MGGAVTGPAHNHRNKSSYARTANASTSKRGRPIVPSSTSFIVCWALAAKRHQNTVFMPLKLGA